MRLAAIALTLTVFCVWTSTASSHVPPPTKQEVNGGLQGRVSHLERVLGHARYMMDRGCVATSAIFNGQTGTLCYWPHYQLAKKVKPKIAYWKRRLAAAQRPPHYYQWLCIHKYEGAWNDPGGPYYGGLQMDWDFMYTYGRHLLNTKGTADHWTPLEQMWVAERAVPRRGFTPWPNTARLCGLL